MFPSLSHSEFDLDHMSAVAAKVGKKVRAILRVNPAIDAGVHSYLATAVDTCKFGIPEKMALAILERFLDNFIFADLRFVQNQSER